MSAGALSLAAVSRRYPGAARAAVDGVTLDVAAGELVALVGASGSGKTTTLRIAAGYEPADAGTVTLDGRDITGLPPEHRGFGMVFQHYALFPHLSVAENVAFGLEARGVGKSARLARARLALDGVGLGEKAARPVQALSGGEQQRVALARALVIEPRVLLLDEPLSNLDPTLRESMRDELRQMLRRSRVTALFVTHDQEDAFAVADRIALLREGRLLQVGTPEALYHAPASRAVADFIGRGAIVPAGDEGTHARVTVGGVDQRVAITRPPGERAGAAAGIEVVLRPEALALTAADVAGAWRGEVRALRFAGASFAYTVALAGGVVVEVASSTRLAREGEPVGVRIAREPLAAVPAGPEAAA
jgi:putative spermidine/putrescine transport system ATP-binding protein